MVNLSIFPRSNGGWLDEDIIFSGIEWVIAIDHALLKTLNP